MGDTFGGIHGTDGSTFCPKYRCLPCKNAETVPAFEIWHVVRIDHNHEYGGWLPNYSVMLFLLAMKAFFSAHGICQPLDIWIKHREPEVENICKMAARHLIEFGALKFFTHAYMMDTLANTTFKNNKSIEYLHLLSTAKKTPHMKQSVCKF